MEPRAKAGVNLSFFVLYVISGSIIALSLMLLWLSYSVNENVQRAYAQVLNPSRIGSEFYTLGRVEHLIQDYENAVKDPNWQMPTPSGENQTQVMAFLSRLPSVTAEQKSALGRCAPLPSGDSRSQVLLKCISVLNDIRQAALETAASVSNAQIAAESVDKLLAHRQSLFNFWLQAAQLILLNLLLPLLTALFGYIFGSQQAGRSQ